MYDDNTFIPCERTISPPPLWAFICLIGMVVMFLMGMSKGEMKAKREARLQHMECNR